MTSVVLDSNVILSNPEILTKEFKNKKIIIPDSVLDELNSVNVHDQFPVDLSETIYEAAQKDYIEIFDTESFLTNVENLPGAKIYDSILISFFKEYSRLNPDSILVTADKFVINLLKNHSLNFVTPQNFLKENSVEYSINTEFEAKLNDLKKKYRKRLLTSFSIGFLLATCLAVAYFWADVIISTINVWGTIITLWLSGFLFFYFRNKMRLAYAFLEFIIGLFTSLTVFMPEFTIESIQSTPNTYLKIIAGIYIIVSGLDNFEKSIVGTPAERYWRKIFKK